MAQAFFPCALRPPKLNAVVAACFVAVVLVEVGLAHGIERWLAGSLLVLAAIALAWRRRAPLAVLVVTAGAIALSAVVAAPIDSLIVVIPMLALALYSVAAHGTPRHALAGLVFCVAMVWIATFAEQGPGGENLVFGVVVPGSPWLAGWMVRRRTEQAVALALRAQELEHSQVEREQAAVLSERTRIARELHDVIAHSVSVMTIQAGAVEQVLERDPEKARAAAAAIRQIGRQSQADLRRLLGVLREDDAEAHPLPPQPGFADLDELICTVRQTGMEVRLTVDGPARTLPPALDLSAFPSAFVAAPLAVVAGMWPRTRSSRRALTWRFTSRVRSTMPGDAPRRRAHPPAARRPVRSRCPSEGRRPGPLDRRRWSLPSAS